MTRSPLALCLTLLGLGCRPAPAESPKPTLEGPEPAVSLPAEPPKEKTSDPFEVGGLVVEEWLPMLKGPLNFAEVTLAPAPKGVAKAPKACDAYPARKAKAKEKEKPKCETRASALSLLDAALGVEAADERDQALVELEECAGLPAGFVRSLRAELGPRECADALIEPYLAKEVAGMEGAIKHALVGQALAARLTRTASAPPTLKAPFTKARVLEFSKGPMLGWMKTQGEAVQELSRSGAGLSYYGKGVVALAAGTADMRMVDAVRQVPIPDEFKTDPELAEAYYASLDEQLEPRKTRGRDAALVGLREFAFAGIIFDDRVVAARMLLAKLFGGRRVDALDALLLPPRSAPDLSTEGARLAARLPTFHAGLVLTPELVSDPKVLAALAHKGLPVPHRVRLKEDEARLTNEQRVIVGTARLLMGIQFWRDEDFDAAAALLAKVEPRAGEPRFLLALAQGLRRGPDDVAKLMLQNEGFGSGFGDVRALDVVASEQASEAIGARAAYDAAVIRQIAAPRDAKAEYWEALAKRYEKAESMLGDPTAKLEAHQRAKAAHATAAVLAKSER